MKRVFKQIIILVCLIAVLILPYFVFAVDTPPLKKLNNVAGQGGYEPLTAGQEEKAVPDILAAVVQGFLGLLGVIFLILLIYGGYTWMTARGEEEKVEKAKDTIRRAIIGLAIIVAAFSITYFVFANLPGGVGGGGPGSSSP